MIRIISLKAPRLRWTKVHILFGIADFLLAILVLHDYIEWGSVNFLIGLAALPVVMQQTDAGKSSQRFGWLSLAMLLACMALPVKTAYYVAAAAAILYIREAHYGKLTSLPFLMLMLMSPVCQYFAQVFSFPVRLWLTKIAGNLLIHSGMQTTVAGNVIACATGNYSVDPACMGLNMLVTSLLCGLMMLGFYQQKEKKKVSILWIAICLAALFCFNVGANLMRILMLVYFRLLPANPMHGFSGIVCLAIYVLLPAMWLTRTIVRKKGIAFPATSLREKTTLAPQINLKFLLLPLMLIAALIIQRKTPQLPIGNLPVLAGYRCSWYDHDVVKVEHPGALIYLKPVRGFLYTDHNPLLCWTGSGYEFNELSEQQWGNIPVFTGVLHKGKEQLYTAWWYDNGPTKTTSQIDWRWKMIQGAPSFTIINVTANSREELQREVARFAALNVRL